MAVSKHDEVTGDFLVEETLTRSEVANVVEHPCRSKETSLRGYAVRCNLYHAHAVP